MDYQQLLLDISLSVEKNIEAYLLKNQFRKISGHSMRHDITRQVLETLISTVYKHRNVSQSELARILGVNRNTLRSIQKDLGIKLRSIEQWQ